MRYYSVNAPISLESFPRDGAISIHNYDGIEYVPQIGRNAWGYIDYRRLLSDKECNEYGLVGGSRELFFESAQNRMEDEHNRNGYYGSWLGFQCPCCSGQAMVRKSMMSGSLIAKCSLCGLEV